MRALGKCLDATGPSSADGTPLQIWDCFAGANQRWTPMHSSTIWPGFTFWSANRDRPCTGGGADTCSGIAQNAWDFTRVIAQYQG